MRGTASSRGAPSVTNGVVIGVRCLRILAEHGDLLSYPAGSRPCGFCVGLQSCSCLQMSDPCRSSQWKTHGDGTPWSTETFASARTAVALTLTATGRWTGVSRKRITTQR